MSKLFESVHRSRFPWVQFAFPHPDFSERSLKLNAAGSDRELFLQPYAGLWVRRPTQQTRFLGEEAGRRAAG